MGVRHEALVPRLLYYVFCLLVFCCFLLVCVSILTCSKICDCVPIATNTQWKIPGRYANVRICKASLVLCCLVAKKW